MGVICLFFSGLIYLFLSVSREDMGTYSTLIANILLFSVIILFILTGVRKKINVYDSFVEGAKEGFTTAVRIIPYLVAFLVGIAVFRTSGAMDFLAGQTGPPGLYPWRLRFLPFAHVLVDMFGCIVEDASELGRIDVCAHIIGSRQAGYKTSKNLSL